MSTAARVTRVTCVTTGAGLVVVGMVGLVGALGTAVIGWVVFLAGCVALHDGVLGPLTEVVARAVRRLPSWTVGPVVVGLAVMGSLAVIALPLILGFGRDPANPSALPRSYSRGLVALSAVTWLVVGIALVVRVRRHPPVAPAAQTR